MHPFGIIFYTDFVKNNLKILFLPKIRTLHQIGIDFDTDFVKIWPKIRTIFLYFYVLFWYFLSGISEWPNIVVYFKLSNDNIISKKCLMFMSKLWKLIFVVIFDYSGGFALSLNFLVVEYTTWNHKSLHLVVFYCYLVFLSIVICRSTYGDKGYGEKEETISKRFWVF